MNRTYTAEELKAILAVGSLHARHSRLHIKTRSEGSLMTPERIAELRKRRDDWTLDSGDMRAVIDECLDDIELAQVTIAAQSDNVSYLIACQVENLGEIAKLRTDVARLREAFKTATCVCGGAREIARRALGVTL